jgi:Ca-activated chloride channel family protein
MSKDQFTIRLKSDLEIIAQEVPSARILQLVVTSPLAKPRAGRLPLNLALVIDRSGSMTGQKIEYVKKAALHVLDLLGEGDRAALVAYNEEVSLLSPSVAMNSAAKERLRSLVGDLTADGFTNLGGGWLRGCEALSAVEKKEMLNRTLLLSDGLANRGITDLEELGHHAMELHRRGISTSTFGVGLDFNEHLLELMANQGGGNYHYIEQARQIPEIFAKELGELTAITAAEVLVVLTLPPKVDVEALGGWRCEQDGRALRLHLGDMAAGQKREVFLKLLTPPQARSKSLSLQATVTARGQDDEQLSQTTKLKLHYDTKGAMEAAQPDKELLRRFAEVRLADASTEALKLEREGKREEARQMLEIALQSCAPYAAPELKRDYQRLAQHLVMGLAEPERKLRHTSEYLRRHRRDQ